MIGRWRKGKQGSPAQTATRAETKRAEKKATQSGSRVEDLQRRSPLARQLLSFNLLALTIPTLGLLYLGDYGRSFSEIERDATSDTVEIIAATVAQRIQHDARVHSDEHETSEEIISEELLSRLISVAALHRSTLYVYVLDPYREVEPKMLLRFPSIAVCGRLICSGFP